MPRPAEIKWPYICVSIMCDYLSAPARLARMVDLAGRGAVKFSLAALQSLLCDSPFLPASTVQLDPQIPPGLLFLLLVFTVNTPLEGISGEPSTCCISGGSEAAGAQSKPQRTSRVKLSSALPSRQRSCTLHVLGLA